MWHGYSSYRLVFGINPNLPNIMTDNRSGLHGATMSKILVKHLEALHEWISQSMNVISQELQHEIRAPKKIFNP